MSDEFSPFAVSQQPAHCGPASLSSCLFMLGIEADQRQIARAAGKPFRIYRQGTNERDLMRASRRFGAASRMIGSRQQQRGPAFIRAIRMHLECGPAIMLVEDFQHWIAVVGYLRDQKKFVIYDPAADEPFNRWSYNRILGEAWNESPHPDHDSTYFALLVSRRDNRPPVWRITRPWMNLHNRGSDQTASGITEDLRELAGPQTGGPLLAAVLRKHQKLVVDQITGWSEGSGEHSKEDLRDLYGDYVTCAEALGLQYSGHDTRLVTGMTALLSAYWWGAEM